MCVSTVVCETPSTRAIVEPLWPIAIGRSAVVNLHPGTVGHEQLERSGLDADAQE